MSAQIFKNISFSTTQAVKASKSHNTDLRLFDVIFNLVHITRLNTVYKTIFQIFRFRPDFDTNKSITSIGCSFNTLIYFEISSGFGLKLIKQFLHYFSITCFAGIYKFFLPFSPLILSIKRNKSNKPNIPYD